MPTDADLVLSACEVAVIVTVCRVVITFGAVKVLVDAPPDDGALPTPSTPGDEVAVQLTAVLVLPVTSAVRVAVCPPVRLFELVLSVISTPAEIVSLAVPVIVLSLSRAAVTVMTWVVLTLEGAV